MKKLCFAVFVCFGCIIGQARADIHAYFLRIECNQDFGLLKIGYSDIHAYKIGDYFENVKPFYKYSINTDGEDKSHAEMILISSFADKQLPYTYRCQLSEHQIYEVYVQLGGHNPDCLYYSEPTFEVTVTDYMQNKKVLVDKVEVGCGSKIKDFYLARGSDDDVEIEFYDNKEIALFYRGDKDYPITHEKIDKTEEFQHEELSKKEIIELNEWRSWHGLPLLPLPLEKEKTQKSLEK